MFEPSTSTPPARSLAEAILQDVRFTFNVSSGADILHGTREPHTEDRLA